MTPRIVRVIPDTVSDADLGSWYRCEVEVVRADHPDGPPPTFDEVVATRWPVEADERVVWLALDNAGAVTGTAKLDLLGGTNAHLAAGEVVVRPAARRRGVGRALAGTALRAVRDSGRETERNRSRRGDPAFSVAVREDATGAVAGFTEVIAWPGNPRAHQDDMTVLPGYRGRGFALWVQAAMIVWLWAECPKITEYETGNADVNEHMIAVNEGLGYRPVDTLVEWRRTVTA